MDIDDIPAVASGARAPPEYAEAEEQEETFDHLGPDELLTHPNWKARKFAFEQALNVVDDSKPFIMPVIGKLIKEPNAAALEALLELELAMLNSSTDDDVAHLCSATVKTVVEKGLVGRPKTAKLATDILSFFCFGSEGAQTADALIAAFSSKVPKNRLAAVQALTGLVSEFGVSMFPMKAIFKSLTPLFNDVDGKVRKQTMQLCCQCFRFTGPAINSFLTDLRDVQRQELEQHFQSVEVGARPEKQPRKAPADAPRPSRALPPHATSAGSAAGGGGGGGVDMFSMMDEMPVLARLPKNFYAVALDKTQKWQERAAMITDGLLPLVSAPRLRPDDDYTDLVKAVRDLLNDPQAPIMMAAFKVTQGLTAGLRNNLAPYARHLIPAVFDKLKDKKASLLETVYATLHAMVETGAAPLDAMLEEFEAAAASKIPHHRMNLVAMVARLTHGMDAARLQRVCRSSMHARLIADEKADTRDAALALIAQLMAVCGDAPFKQLLATLDEKQLQKIRGAPGGSAPSLAPGAAAPRGAANSSVPLSRTATATSSKAVPAAAAPVKSLSSGSLRSVPSGSHVSNTTTPTSGSANRSPAVAAAGGDDALESGTIGIDDAVAALAEQGPEIMDLLGSKEWKARMEGAVAVQAVVETWDAETATAAAEAVIVIFKNRPTFKESIFQVFNAVLAALQALLARVKSLPQRTAFMIVNGVAPKLTEAKSKAMVRSLLSTVAEFVGPKFVHKYVMQIVVAQKKPTLTTEALDWLDESLGEFAQAPVDAKAIVDFVVSYCFEQSSPQIKQAAVKLLVTMRRRVGPKLDAFTTNINAHLKATLDAEVQKDAASGPLPPPAVTRVMRDPPAASASAAPARGGGGSGPGASAKAAASAGVDGAALMNSSQIDSDDFPRTDVSAQTNAQVKIMTTAPDWKDRLAAVKRIEQIMVAANKNVAPNGITELLKALRTRFDEPNKNMVVDVLRVMLVVVDSAGGAGARPGLKHVIQPLLALLGDQKAPLRDAAVDLAAVAFSHLGLDNVLPMLPKALAADTQGARLNIVTLMEALMQGLPAASNPAMLKNMQAIVAPLLRLVMDRTVEVRSRAERLVITCASVVGVDFVCRAITDLKPAEQQQLRGLQERLYVCNAPPCPTVAPSAGSAAAGSSPLPQSGRPGAASRATVGVTAGAPNNAAAAAAVNAADHASTQRVSAFVPPTRAEPYTPREIIASLPSARLNDALHMCQDFQFRLESGEAVLADQRIVDVMFRRLAAAFVEERSSDLARTLLEALIAAFRTPVSSKFHTTQLYEWVGVLYQCLLSDLATTDRPAIRGLNDLMRAFIECCNADELFAALMSRLTSYSTDYLKDPTRMNHKFVEITAKCIFRYTVDQLRIDTIIMTAHESLVAHPPSAFRDRDDLTIRTIKTLLSDATKLYGSEILDTCVDMIGRQCLVYNFLHVCQNKYHPSEQQQRPAQLQPPPSHVDPRYDNKENGAAPMAMASKPASPAYASPAASPESAGEIKMGSIFSKMKRHATADAGFEELYIYLRDHGDGSVFADFDSQFAICSEQFRQYVVRRMQRLMSTKGESFALPRALGTA